MAEREKQDAVTEFYCQLALLLQSRLPLPESVAGIAASGWKRPVRQALEDIAGRLAEGRSLSDALAAHRELFPPVHLTLIQAAEQSEALPEVLRDLADLARRNQALATRLKELSMYPFVTVFFAVTLILGLARFYLPGFGRELRAMLEGPLPLFSTTLFAGAEAVVRWWPGVLVAYGLFALAWFVFVFGGSFWGRRLPGPAAIAPGARQTGRLLDLARFCGTAALLLRRGLPLDDVLGTAGAMLLDPGLKRALEELRQRCATGLSLARAAEDGDALPGSLRVALTCVRDADLADEIDALRDFYLEQAEAAARRVAFLWQGIAFALMVAIAASVVFAMFMPMIQLYQQMSGVFQ